MTWIFTIMLLLPPMAPRAQAAEGDSAADHGVMGPAATNNRPLTTDNSDMMRPTQRGLRLTPRMAEAFAAYYVADEVKTIVPVTPEQQSRLAEALSRRMMAMARTHSKEIRDGVESGLALLLATDDHFDAQTGKEFAERTRHMIPILRKFLKAVDEEARPVLEADHYEVLGLKLKREAQELDRLERKMGRWAAGGAIPRERLDQFDPADGPEVRRDERERRYSQPMSRRRQAERDLSLFGPEQWERFLAGAKRFFEFDEKQTAEGNRLLAEYRDKAEAIMTADWRERVVRNRMRYYARFDVHDIPSAPWAHQINQSYRKDVAPVEAIAREFREKVISLATAKQRDAARRQIEEAAQRLGIKLEDADARVLHLQP